MLVWIVDYPFAHSGHTKSPIRVVERTSDKNDKNQGNDANKTNQPTTNSTVTFLDAPRERDVARATLRANCMSFTNIALILGRVAQRIRDDAEKSLSTVPIWALIQTSLH